MSLIYSEVKGLLSPAVAKVSLELARTSVPEIFQYYYAVLRASLLGSDAGIDPDSDFIKKEELMMSGSDDEEVSIKEEMSSEGEIHSD
jgi:hypothetical protein